MSDPNPLEFTETLIGSAANIGSDIFGDTTATTGKGTRAGTTTEQLELDPEAIEKILQDVLGSQQGLASIFSGEQTAGIYDSSVAAQASGNLLANLAGEIAKLTAKKVKTEDIRTGQKQEAKEEGLLDQIGGFFGF